MFICSSLISLIPVSLPPCLLTLFPRNGNTQLAVAIRLKQFFIIIASVLFWVSIVVKRKRHPDRTTLIHKNFNCGGSVTFKRVSPLSSQREARQHGGTHGNIERARSSYTFSHRQQRYLPGSQV